MKTEHPPGATPIDPDEAAGLIPEISTRYELNLFEEENILEAFRWARRSRKLKREFCTISGLRSLHRKMFSRVWKWAGTFRRSEKNIGVAPHNIQTELGQLCGNVEFQVEHHSLPLELIATSFHHQLTRIHPFPNGNGRHARLSADLLLIFRGVRPFSWGQASLLSAGEGRAEYLSALRYADNGDLEPLLKFARSK